VALLNWHFGLSQLTLWRIELAPSQICRTWLPPQKPIITIPITLYGYGNGDDAEEGGLPRDGAMGGSMGSTSATKSDASVKLRVPTSSRTSLPARIEIAVPLGRKEPALLNTPHPRSDPQDLGERPCSTWTRRSRW
jgi:hypothetical protein